MTVVHPRRGLTFTDMEEAGLPTKRTFDLVVLTTVGVHFAWSLVKLWAARTLAEPGNGFATSTAGAVMVAG